MNQDLYSFYSCKKPQKISLFNLPIEEAINEQNDIKKNENNSSKIFKINTQDENYFSKFLNFKKELNQEPSLNQLDSFRDEFKNRYENNEFSKLQSNKDVDEYQIEKRFV